jgi:RsiW-degrading membrane proteinase PrsW (M82 family)
MTVARALPLENLSRPRWGFQVGLIQPRMPAFWLFLSLLLLCGAGLLLVQLGYLAITPIGWLLSWLLMLVYIVPVVLVVRWLDPYEREPRSLLIGAFLWGGVIATVFSSFANYLWGTVVTRVGGAELASDWSAALTAPVVEELYKALGVVVLYLIARSELDDLMDGFVYGALVGLGFAVVEDVDYFISVFGGTIGGVLEGFWVRVIASGLFGHVLYTGLAGIGIAYFVTRQGVQPVWRRMAVGVALLGLAMLAHFVWNSPLFWDTLPLPLAAAAKGVPFLIALVILLRLARRRENRWMAAALEREVGGPGLAREELVILSDWRHRRGARKRVGAKAGRDAQRLEGRLQHEQLALAMMASRTTDPADPDLLRQRARIQQLRDQLWAIPGVVGALQIPEATVHAMRAMGRVVLPFGDAGVAAAPTPATPERAWVSDTGATAWAFPDPTNPPIATLEPGLAVEVTQRTGGWAEVRTAEGNTGWVDARLLTSQPPPRRSYWR